MAVLPDRYTALPVTLMQVKVEVLLADMNRSPMRPPQPVVAPSAADACQYDCWSLCENSLGGSGTERAMYCSRVVGCTRVPTLCSTAMRPCWNSGSRPVPRLGARAKARPSVLPPEGVSTLPASASRVKAMLLRRPWYSAWCVLS